ncbi:MAG: hydroxyacylglutathione hydrolase [Mariprofundus sp.]|nr:hydroxyacylglutathione hydrolase [Mariprofundus sp.]
MWSYQHPGFTVHQLPALRDNYIYLIEADSNNTLIAVDPAEAVSVHQACRHMGKPLTHIFNTHHHWDHTDGNLSLKKDFGCLIVGAEGDAARIPGIDITVTEASPPALAGLDISVLDVPGHTNGHIAYIINDALFCGDTLFGAGCGRLFEGTAAQMWNSLNKIAELDGNTKIYCAHEYTLANLAYASAIDANNPALTARIVADKNRRKQDQPTIPSSIDMEKATNPFLRPLDSYFCRNYAAAHNISSEPLSIFSDIRSRKDRW